LGSNDELFNIIDRAKGGDVAAFETLYRDKLKSILFNVKQNIDNPNDAEDVAQEIVLLMYKNLGKLKSPFAFSTWLHRIIVNACYRHNTRNKDNSANKNTQNEMNEISDVDKDVSPSAAFDDSSQRNEIMEAVRNLPLKQRTAIVMYYYDEMSQAEIGEALGVSEKTVSTNLYKAKKNLKTLLNEKYTDTDLDIDTQKSGGARASVLAVAFHEAADLNFQNTDVDKLCHNINDKIANPIVKGTAKGVKTGKGFGITVAITTVVTAIAVVGIVFITQGTLIPEAISSEPNPAIYTEVEDEVAPENVAAIVFENEVSAGSHINPSGASIELENPNYTAVAWAITGNANETEFATGKGNVTATNFETLPTGEYRLTWKVKGEAQDFTVYRDFTIQK
jgi:RNA polymerase sigma-70 factor (ECF subfamily)